MSIVWVRRRCWFGRCPAPHSWEVLNPDTDEPFRRGRVVFFCAWRPRQQRNDR